MKKIVLLRHGESAWNKENRFTGWTDVDLTDAGREQARLAGELLKEKGFEFDLAYSSVLKRAIRTLWIALDAMDAMYTPVGLSWRLNERHYGALQGLNKKETSERYGAEQVFAWRRSYDVPPPPLALDDPQHPRHDPRYASLAPEVIPASECLKDVVARFLPYWFDGIVPDLRDGRTVLVGAHGNTLRAMVKKLDNVSDADIAELNIPTGIPLVYTLDQDLRPVKSEYLGDPEAAKAAAEAVARQAG